MSNKKFNPALTIFCCILALVIGFIAAFFLYSYIRRPTGGDVYIDGNTGEGGGSDNGNTGEGGGSDDGDDTYVSGELSIHFMELGNKYAGDSIYIKAGDADILIDAGSRAGSTDTTSAYIDQFCTDGTLEYVIATHADQDHIAGFAGSNSSPSVFDRYECEVIIDFPKTNKDTQVYNNYVEQRDEAVAGGAEHYTALECWDAGESDSGARRVWEVAPGIEMEILYNYFYENESVDENNYSVCLMFNQGDKHFLFTGDLEQEGEEYLVQYNDLPEVELFKAGHHGSKTSSNDCLLEVIRPKIVCVCCCAGTDEYTDAKENQFPTQAMIDRVAPYTDRVYVTSQVDESAESGYRSMNGNIVVTSNSGGVTVKCSDNDTLLKDTEWFAENRTMPEAWKRTAA